MSRYHKLLEKINIVLKYDKSGKAQWRLVRIRILKKVIKDLITIKMLPPDWQYIKNEHILALINYWRRKNLTESTIATYLAAIRYFFNGAKINTVIATNIELGVSRQYNSSTKSITIEDYQRILHPYIKCILGFELLFGTHRAEAIKIRCTDNLLFDDKLWITRNIAFNGIERFIPVITQEQRDLIALFKSTVPYQQSILDRVDKRSVMALYKAELATISLPATEQYRKHYVKYRSKMLEDVVVPRQLKAIIKNEIGIKSDNLLRAYLA